MNYRLIEPPPGPADRERSRLDGRTWAQGHETDAAERRRLQRDIRAELAGMRDDPEARFRGREAFFARWGFGWSGGAGFGSAELAVLAWQIDRGVLSPRGGSAWWRGVQEHYAASSLLAAAAYERGLPAASSGERLWRAYFEAPSARSYYRAHNASIVDAYLAHRAEARAEPPAEQRLINAVLWRLLYAQALAERESVLFGLVGPAAVDPRWPLIDLLVASPWFYPERYPCDDASLERATRLAPGRSGALRSFVGFSRRLEGFVTGRQLTHLYACAARWNDVEALARFVDASGRALYPDLAAPCAAARPSPLSGFLLLPVDG